MNLLKVRDGLFVTGVILLALFLVLTLLPLVVFQMGWALAGDLMWVFPPTLVVLFLGFVTLWGSILVDKKRRLK
jgi:hypothetical protein